MSLTEHLTSAQYLIDTEGNKKAVVLDLAAWEEILTLLEDVADEQRWDELFAKSPDVLARLANEARAERLRMQNEYLRQLLHAAPDDDKGPEWWDEFEQELRQNRVTFPVREVN
jgi:hypothetical protein